VALTIPPGAQPLVTLARASGQVISAALEAEIATTTLTGATPAGAVRLTTGTTGLTGTWEPAAGAKLDLAIAGATGELPQKGWLFEGIAANAELGPDGSAEFALTGGTVRQRAVPAWLVPVRLTASGHMRDGAIDFAGRIGDASGRLDLALAGRHDLAQGTGTGTLELKPVEFTPGHLQPETLFPAAGALAWSVAGRVALSGPLRWDHGQVTSDLRLLIKDLSFTSMAGEVDQLNGVIAIAQLNPLATRPGQSLALEAVQAALPLTDGLIRFAIEDGKRLRIESGRLHLAGGTVEIGPTLLDAEPPAGSVRLDVRDVDLALLMNLAGLDGLTGTGSLSGTIPVTLAPAGITIDAGTLKAAGPGVIAYAPATPPPALQGGNETVSLALSALKDFRYKTLSLTLNRAPGGQTVLALHVEGSNPSFYNGYPVQFNINISGKLDQILRQSLVGYTVPEAIRRDLERYPIKPASNP
jgi:hypothetical protein